MPRKCLHSRIPRSSPHLGVMILLLACSAPRCSGEGDGAVGKAGSDGANHAGGSPAPGSGGGGSESALGGSSDGGAARGGGGGHGNTAGLPSGGGGAGAASVTAGGGGADGNGTGGRTGGRGGGSAVGGRSNAGPGGSSGGLSAGGSGGQGGVAGTDGVDGGAGRKACKRGIAANTPPSAAFYPAISWWYNWAIQRTGTDVGIEFVPMVWNSTTVSASIPRGSRYLLSFNEPNFHAQANLTPQQAASAWPALQANATAAGVPIVSPAMNFCGPASDCNGTDPYQYLKDFFAACKNCQVDYVAVHWYNCDLPSLKDYLEPGGALEGFEQFGKPIWITEFSCDTTASVAQQEAYMRAAIPYLENKPSVFRYSWFSAGPIPNAKLMDDQGAPTPLGLVYQSLPQDCQ